MEYKFGFQFHDPFSGTRYRVYGTAVATGSEPLNKKLLSAHTGRALERAFTSGEPSFAYWVHHPPELSTAIGPDLVDVGATSVQVIELRTSPPVEAPPTHDAPVQVQQPVPAVAAPAVAPALPSAIAVGAAVLVMWSDGNRYPATVMQLAQGQYLIAFPNGQQHWLAAQWVTPA